MDIYLCVGWSGDTTSSTVATVPLPQGEGEDITEYFACYLIKCGKSNIF